MSSGLVHTTGGTFTYRKGNVVTDIEMGYHGIFDGEPDKRGWDKCSIDYAMENEKKLVSYIRKMICKYSNSVMADSDDIYQDLLYDLYNAEDFKILEGAKMTSSVGNYVYKRLGFIIDTYRENVCRHKRMYKDNVVKDEDGELVDIFDSIASDVDDYEDLMYENVESFLEPLEIKRNFFGFDIFLAMYVSMLCTNFGIDMNKCLKIVSLLCHKDLCDIRDGYCKLMEDEDATNAVHALIKSKSLTALEKHVYGKEQIQNIIKKCSTII